MGTQEKPKTYKLRLLPDADGDFYVKYYYHFFQDESNNSHYIKCPKTDGFENFCPWCFMNQMLWKGNKSDKERADRYRRNVRFVVNAFIKDDPRDADAEDDFKVSGTRRLYEFPATVESKIANELTNDEEGYGPSIFDPEKGHDLLVKILAKKPDQNGKVWPDYSLTEFSRTANAISESQEEIEKIMNSVYSLKEYIDHMGLSWSEHEKLLKKELVWDDVRDAFIKNVGASSGEEESKSSKSNPADEDNDNTGAPDNEDSSTETEKQTKPEEDPDDVSDDDLLKELQSL